MFYVSAIDTCTVCGNNDYAYVRHILHVHAYHSHTCILHGPGSIIMIMYVRLYPCS